MEIYIGHVKLVPVIMRILHVDGVFYLNYGTLNNGVFKNIYWRGINYERVIKDLISAFMEAYKDIKGTSFEMVG